MLYIFDLDGTVRVTKSGKPCPNNINDIEILPGVLSKLKKIDRHDIIAAASNQGGVACGYMTEMEAWGIALETNRLCWSLFRDMRLSFFHPQGKFKYPNTAKPKPDMLIALAHRWEHDVSDTRMIGDAFTDKKAAESFGVKFIWAHDFFGWGNDAVEETEFGFFPKSGLKRWQK